MTVGDETYLKGGANIDGAIRLLEVPDADGDGSTDVALQRRDGGTWRTLQVRQPALRPTFPGELGTIGHSRVSLTMDFSSPGSAARVTGQSIAAWVSVYSNGLLRSAPYLNMATYGSLTDDLDRQITALLAAGRPAACLVCTGINDPNPPSAGGTTADEVVRRVVRAWYRLLDAGILPIHVQDFPCGLLSQAINAKVIAAGVALARLAPKMGVYLYDPANLVVDRTVSSNSGLLSALTGDSVHQNDYGAKLIGKAIAAGLLSRYSPSWPSWGRGAGAGDKYDATVAPQANLIKNPEFLGTGGANQGSGTPTGSIPNTTYINLDTNYTVSVAADADGVRWLTLAMTPGVAGSYGIVQFAGLTPGSRFTCSASVDLDVDYGTAASSSAGDFLQTWMLYDPSYTYQPTLLHQGVGCPLAFKGRLVIPDHLVPADSLGGTGTWLGVEFIFSQSGAKTVKMALPSVRAMA